MGLSNNIKWVAVSQAVRVLAQFVGLAVFARVLSPNDFGVMAMAAVVTAFAFLFRDFGTASALIQREDANDAFRRTVFWFNVSLGGLIGVVVAVTAYPVAMLFGSERLAPVLVFLAASFPIASTGAAHQALLERGSRFALIARIESVASLLGLAAGIGAALLGAGVYSLVVQTLVQVLVSTFQLWRASDWRPGFRPEFSAWGDLLGFSGNVSAFNFINYFSRNADSFLIGRVLGEAALGAYALAYRLMLFPVQNLTFVVTRSMYPVMSRLQDDVEGAGQLYVRATAGVCAITAPLMAGLWVLRDDFVPVVFGPQWQLASEVLTWLAPTGFIQSIVSTTGTVLMARAKTGDLLRLGVVGAVLQVGAFVLSVREGVVALSAAYFVANVVNAGIALSVVLAVAKIRPLVFARALMPAMACAFAMAVVIWGARAFSIDLAAGAVLARLVAAVILGAAAYAVLLRVFDPKSFAMLLRRGG